MIDYRIPIGLARIGDARLLPKRAKKRRIGVGLAIQAPTRVNRTRAKKGEDRVAAGGKPQEADPPPVHAAAKDGVG